MTGLGFLNKESWRLLSCQSSVVVRSLSWVLSRAVLSEWLYTAHRDIVIGTPPVSAHSDCQNWIFCSAVLGSGDDVINQIVLWEPSHRKLGPGERRSWTSSPPSQHPGQSWAPPWAPPTRSPGQFCRLGTTLQQLRWSLYHGWSCLTSLSEIHLDGLNSPEVGFNLVLGLLERVWPGVLPVPHLGGVESEGSTGRKWASRSRVVFLSLDTRATSRQAGYEGTRGRFHLWAGRSNQRDESLLQLTPHTASGSDGTTNTFQLENTWQYSQLTSTSTARSYTLCFTWICNNSYGEDRNIYSFWVIFKWGLFEVHWGNCMKISTAKSILRFL